MSKTALITGVTGQDGALLAELLLAKGYTVHGVKRRSSSFNSERIDHLYKDPHKAGTKFFLHYGDLTDSTNLIRLVQETQPDEIYNLAAQSHVQVSFETAEYTANADGIGVLRLLEAIRILKMENKVRFYQASTSELYGKVQETPQRETTPFYPRSPYGAAKLYGYWITVNYREAYGMHASNGILFNHEGPTRGETFVTRKITRAVAAIHHGLQDTLYVGNLDAKVAPNDVVMGVAASGTTPFTIGALRAASAAGAVTIAIANNAGAPIFEVARHHILAETGSEVIAGSTRMKAGTAQKIILNLISTTIMVKMGRVYRGLMVDMRARNAKLRRRAQAIVSQIAGCSESDAAGYLEKTGGELKPAVLVALGLEPNEAARLLDRCGRNLRAAIVSMRGDG